LGTFAVAQIVRVLPRTHISRAVGRLCDLELPPLVSRAMVGAYASAFDVDLDEAVLPNGRGAFASFDAFFTRRVRSHDGIAPPETVTMVSPADGRLEQFGRVEPGGNIRVKGRAYSALDLLGDPQHVDRFAAGRYAVVYLSPRDYHRVHAPAAGRIVEVRSMPGDLLPVNSVGQLHFPDVLVRNRRVAIFVETAELGWAAVVMVAAMLVGRISVTGFPERDVPLGTHLLDAPIAVDRGDELGIFHLGSTVVLFTERGAAGKWIRALGRIQMGEPLAEEADEAAGTGGWS